MVGLPALAEASSEYCVGSELTKDFAYNYTAECSQGSPAGEGNYPGSSPFNLISYSIEKRQALKRGVLTRMSNDAFSVVGTVSAWGGRKLVEIFKKQADPVSDTGKSYCLVGRGTTRADDRGQIIGCSSGVQVLADVLKAQTMEEILTWNGYRRVAEFSPLIVGEARFFRGSLFEK